MRYQGPNVDSYPGERRGPAVPSIGGSADPGVRSETPQKQHTVPQRVSVLGYQILNVPAQVLFSTICDEFSLGRCRSFVFLNPHTVVLANSDDELARALDSPTEAICDGVGLALASLVLNRERLHRIWGWDFFIGLSKALSDRGLGRVFFLGGHEEFAGVLVDKYRSHFPGIQKVEVFVPPHKAEFDDGDILDMARRIKAFNTDVLWIGVGSPKQEKLMRRLYDVCPVRCAAAIGAVFDFYSGRVPLAPLWVREMGLQWAYRLLLEPKRLWRRTFVSGPLFVSQVLRDLLSPRQRAR